MLMLDTGSGDETPAIARACGAEVHHAFWPDDFAAARNLALQLADADWCLMLDADEWISVVTTVRKTSAPRFRTGPRSGTSGLNTSSPESLSRTHTSRGSKNSALRVVVAVLLVKHSRGSGLRHAVDVVLQSRPPQHGTGWFHPKAAFGQSCITVLLLSSVEIGGITIFAKRMESLADHLARHRLADLFIDTLPFNAHTTASDALSAGLPVLTCIGTTFAGRVAASLLKAIELPELITSTQEDYEAMAVELATNPAKLLSIRLKLDNNRLTTALFDTRRFTKNIENIYRQMHENQHADVAVAQLNIVTV